jgi:hypothetical protein
MKRSVLPATVSVAFLLILTVPHTGAQQPQRNVSEVVKATVDSVVLIVGPFV